MRYKMLGGYLPELYKDRQDPLFHYDESWELAQGDGWFANIESCGEVRLYKNRERLSPSDFEWEYDTDEDMCRAVKSGELEIENNNWYEVQLFAETDDGRIYLDLTSDLVAYSFEECIEQFNSLMADKEWCNELEKELKRIKKERRKIGE